MDPDTLRDVDEGVREALVTSVGVAVVATLLALVLGTLLALALGRYAFFGRESISMLVILPIALPGIVTGIALNNVFTTFLGGLTIVTLIVGQLIFSSVRSPFVRLGVALLFAAPAAIAGYHATHGIAAMTIPSETWQQVIAVIGSITVGITAWTRMAMLSPGPAASGNAANPYLR